MKGGKVPDRDDMARALRIGTVLGVAYGVGLIAALGSSKWEGRAFGLALIAAAAVAAGLVSWNIGKAFPPAESPRAKSFRAMPGSEEAGAEGRRRG